MKSLLLFAAILLFIILFISPSCTAKVINTNKKQDEIFEEKPINYRLPTAIIPESYTIKIYPSLDPAKNFSFTGVMKIKTRVYESTNQVVLHRSKDIKIDTFEFINNKNDKIESVKDFYDEKTEKHTFILSDNLDVDSGTDIAISYTGFLKKSTRGFYKSSYWSSDKTSKYVAATQFHTIFARHAFPCFDEPQYKTTFSIIIRRSKSFSSLSNMPINYTDEMGNGEMSDTFEVSKPMSTYLVAFVISEFQSVADDNNALRVWARPEAIKQAEYSLNIGRQAREFFSALFNENYHLPKLDMVAIPDMFHGAMENWGLITFNENRLLYDNEHTSDIDQQKIASTVVHEWTHMWFGNLVTPNWWGCTWLSEGFATYFEYIGFTAIEPHWNMEQQFVVDKLQPVFIDDGVDSSTPLTKIAETSRQIIQVGNTITYSKGASIVRMMNLIFGPSIFDSALIQYLKSKRYDTANPDDLWSNFQNQVDQSTIKLPASVKTIMDSWTIQSGFPVLSVVIDDGIAKLHQERYLIRNSNSASTNSTWWIPLTWTTSSSPNFDDTKPKYWLSKEDDQIDLKISNDEWVIFNIQQSGFYRVNYDRKLWYRIIDTLNSDNYEKISVINRAAIIDDLLNLARAGFVSYEDALNGLKYIKKETHYLPIKSALTGLKYLYDRFAGQKYGELFNNFTLSLISPIYDRLGYSDKPTDDRLTILLRAEINQWACDLGHEECNRISLQYFSDWSKNPVKRYDNLQEKISIPKNQRKVTYCTAVKHDSSNNTNNAAKLVRNQHKTSIIATERTVALESLSCLEDTAILTNILNSALEDYEISSIRNGESISIFRAITKRSYSNAKFILDFIAENKEAISKYYGSNAYVAHIISTAATMLATPEGIAKLGSFIDQHHTVFQDISDSLQNSLKIATYELNFYEEYHPDIIKGIKSYNKEMEKEEGLKYWLPKNIIPKNYAIKLTPHISFDNFTFDGWVQITTVVKTNTTSIVLHVHDIIWETITLVSNGKQIKTVSIKDDQMYDFLIITTAEELISGSELIIEIKYMGYLNNEMKGFYRSSYIDNFNQTKWLAASHLEPVGARRMFPCFDEPSLKATFQLNVSRLGDFKTISNTKLKFTIQENGRFLDVFEKTPIMSTYLVALVVSDFKSVGELNLFTWAIPNSIQQASYAFTFMKPILDYFEKTLGHKYQLPKLDMVALPDFASGAMENWGLITYKESRLLYDPNYNDITSKQAIAYVIAHEIAHQWFGNLVSPHWWKDVWLSEGFARYFQYVVMSNLEPTWGSESQIVTDHLQSSFLIDSLPSSHPLSHDVFTPDEIRSIFDQISYAKGASILRMIEKILGSNVFFQSLHNYLNETQYQSAIPDNLYAAFQHQADVSKVKLPTSVKMIMNSWVTKAGFPVLYVEIDGGIAKLSQERFLLNNPDKIPTNDIWWIPITWSSSLNINFMNTVPKYWLNKTVDSISIEMMNDDDWIIFNVQQAGYYRVNYDDATWARIIKTLNSTNYNRIHPINRASIIDDLFNLARARYIDYSVTLSATQYLSQEINYIPWKAAFNNFDYLNRKITQEYISPLLKRHILTLLKPVYKKLEFEVNIHHSHFDKLLQMNVVDWACKLNYDPCIKASLKKFEDWKLYSSKLVPVNLRKTIYCTSVKWGSSDNWDFLWNKFQLTNSAYEKEVIIHALGCTNHREKIQKLLMSAITENSGIRLQDSPSVFSSVYSSGLYGTEQALDFVSKNYQSMYNYYKNYNQVKSILKGISSHSSSRESVLKFEDFVNTHGKNLSIIEESLKSFLDQARYDVNMVENYSPKIHKWLSSTYSSSDYRLPKNIIPAKYEIYLIPYLQDNTFSFDGTVTMTLNIVESTSSIVLHSHELEIFEIKVNMVNTMIPIEVSDHTFGLHHKLNIYLKNTVQSGSILSVFIKYSGKLNTKMEGFYRSYYKSDNGDTHWLAATQFQKYGARQAFPCFDEPAMKAKFQINIKRLNHYQTLSNMKLSSSSNSTEPNWSWDHYEESHLMSTYLVAFVVSDFKFIGNNDNSFRVWSRPNAIQDAGHALEFGQNSLRFLEGYTEIPYPIGKMDMIAIPDFNVGAMENWGLVTYREYGLLLNTSISPTHSTRYMETLIAHELAHMWFGNLVTCESWDYVWLNEGFAQYFEWLVVNALQPQSRLMDQFTVYELQTALLKDSFIHMRPMNNIMKDPYDDGKDFSAIAYGKSASIIRMMQHAFGDNLFKNALKYYLKQNQYSTSTPQKLWSAIETLMNKLGGINTTNQSVATLMESWASQPGYPVVKVVVVGSTLSLSQERFLFNKNNESHKELYWIPITIATKSNPNFSNTSPTLWLGSQGTSAKVLNLKDEWIILNVQQVGFYRVNYDVNIWKGIIDALNQNNFGGIPEINRAQIVDDLFNLARADYITYDWALDGTQYLINETGHLPWKAFFDAVSFLSERFDNREIAMGFNKYLVKLITPTFQTVGFENRVNDTQIDGLHKNLILSWACKIDLPDCVILSRKIFDEIRRNSNKFISPDAKPAVFCTALKYGDYNDWQFLWQQYRGSNLEAEKVMMISALGCSRNKTAINEYFSHIFSSNGSIRDQNVATAFSSIYSAGKYGVDASFDFLSKNYQLVYKYYSSWDRVGQLFYNVATKISTNSQLSKFVLFVQNKKDELTHISKALNESIIFATNNKRWYKDHVESIENWLISQNMIVTTETSDCSEPGAAVPIHVQTNILSFTIAVWILIMLL